MKKIISIISQNSCN